MSELHYLPPQYVERSYPERLTLRGKDVDTLCEMLQILADRVEMSDVQFDLVDRVMAATGRWGHDEWSEPLDED